MYLDRTNSKTKSTLSKNGQPITLRGCNWGMSEESSIVHDRNRTGGL
nr:MAG TPA: Poxvirus L5 protein family [Caudoviricetes sp.]